MHRLEKPTHKRISTLNKITMQNSQETSKDACHDYRVQEEGRNDQEQMQLRSGWGSVIKPFIQHNLGVEWWDEVSFPQICIVLIQTKGKTTL